LFSFWQDSPLCRFAHWISGKEVVVANGDTNPLVAGDGIRKLRMAGVEVVMGVLEKEGYELNKRFFTFIGKQRRTSS